MLLVIGALTAPVANGHTRGQTSAPDPTPLPDDRIVGPIAPPGTNAPDANAFELDGFTLSRFGEDGNLSERVLGRELRQALPGAPQIMSGARILQYRQGAVEWEWQALRVDHDPETRILETRGPTHAWRLLPINGSEPLRVPEPPAQANSGLSAPAPATYHAFLASANVRVERDTGQAESAAPFSYVDSLRDGDAIGFRLDAGANTIEWLDTVRTRIQPLPATP